MKTKRTLQPWERRLSHQGAVHTAMPEAGAQLVEHCIADDPSLQGQTELLFAAFLQVAPIQDGLERLEPGTGLQDGCVENLLPIDTISIYTLTS